ncbi:hypothetical protein EDEG_03632, partial [Edhazardia aedis USNM 41457]
MFIKLIVLFLGLSISTGRIVIVPIYDEKYGYPPCNLYGLASTYIRLDNIEKYSEILRHFNITNALVDDWEDRPFNGVLGNKATLTPFSPEFNVSKHRICAVGEHGSIVEPDFSLEPRYWVDKA